MLHAPCPIPEARCLVRTNARRQRQQQATRSNALILVTTLPLRFCGWPHLLGKSVAAKALATTNCCSWPSGAINICDSEMQLRGNNEYSRSDCLLFPPFSCFLRTRPTSGNWQRWCVLGFLSPLPAKWGVPGEASLGWEWGHLIMAFFYNILLHCWALSRPLSFSRSDTLAAFWWIYVLLMEGSILAIIKYCSWLRTQARYKDTLVRCVHGAYFDNALTPPFDVLLTYNPYLKPHLQDII